MRLIASQSCYQACARLTRAVSQYSTTSHVHHPHLADLRDSGRALYRGLLRECTYIADLHARSILRHRVSAAFRTHSDPQLDLDHDERITRASNAQRGGQTALRRLRRANDGDTRALRFMIALAYGRRGKRKRQLMRPLMAPGASSSVQEQDGADHLRHTSATWQQHIPPLSDQLKALAKSQDTAYAINSFTTKLKRIGSLQPKIPELNSWFRPTPVCRVRNLTKRWYASLLDRILPPLPLAEWLRMYDIASGATTMHQPSRRGRRQSSALELIACHGRIADSLMDKRSTSTSSVRSLRRAYAQIFAYCSVMSWDARSQRWSVFWGNEALHDPSIARRLRSSTVSSSA